MFVGPRHDGGRLSALYIPNKEQNRLDPALAIQNTTLYLLATPERNYLALHRVILEIERMYITSLTVFTKLSVL